jgi:disulfide bond formation protein DsbB
MSSFTEQFNFLLGIATIIGQGILLVLIILFFLKKKNKITSFVQKYILELLLLVSGAGTFLSLLYSEVLGELPCDLCWYQRIFLYPQVIILAIAKWKKDKSVLNYSLALSVVGALIALYHYYIQWGGIALIPCSGDALASPCAQKTILEFGYITIPFMSLVSFSMMIVLNLIAKKQK